MKPIAVGDRVRVNWPGTPYDKRDGCVRDVMFIGGYDFALEVDGERWLIPIAYDRLINTTPADTTELQPGFYWVRRLAGYEWTVAEWDSTEWWYCGHDNMIAPDEIGERIERKG